MLESKGNMGYDAAQNEYVDLVEAGIVDPTTRRARKCRLGGKRSAADRGNYDRNSRGRSKDTPGDSGDGYLTQRGCHVETNIISVGRLRRLGIMPKPQLGTVHTNVSNK
jgi:hypothetical protein